MIKKTFISAEVRINVKCFLSDKTPIPNALCMSIGQPDDEGIVGYSISAFVSNKQLRQIFKILAKDPKRTQWD